jgi:hypothetical protein
MFKEAFAEAAIRGKEPFDYDRSADNKTLTALA